MGIWSKLADWFNGKEEPASADDLSGLVAAPEKAPAPVVPAEPVVTPASEAPADVPPGPKEESPVTATAEAVVGLEAQKVDSLPPPPKKPGASFDTSILFVLKNEGGYVNNKNDSGGATNYGITAAVYAKYKGKSKVSPAEVKKMTLAEAKAIYKAQYWDSALEELNQNVATAILDWKILHGKQGAYELAQTVANQAGVKPALVVDGDLGPVSIKAINQVSPAAFTHLYAQGMRDWFHNRVLQKPSQKVFLAGWNARAQRIAGLV